MDKNREDNKESNDFLTQFNFKNQINNKTYIKDFASKTAEKSKNNKKESKISLLTKRNKYKNKYQKIKAYDSKEKKSGLKSRNNTTLNSININLNSINNLKISNNLFTTINIYETIKNKNKNKSKKCLKTEISDYKLVNDTYCFDNKKILKIINDYQYINKKSQSNIKKAKIKAPKYNHNKTNTSIYNHLDPTFTINKTSTNFNNLLNKNLILKKAYNNMTNAKTKIRIKNIKPSLVKKIDKSDKDFLYPQNSDRMTTWHKNNDSSKKNLKGNNIVREPSNDEKKANMIPSYMALEQNKEQKKIKIQNFKKLIGNLNSEKKEIDRNKLHAILNEKKIGINKNNNNG